MICALPVMLLGALGATAIAQEGSALSDSERFNYVLGTQTIGASYQFTDEPLLVETAQAILDMGATTIKLNMGKSYFGKKGANVPEGDPAIQSLTQLARDEPSHKRVLDMPFANYLIWAYCFTPGWWSKGFSQEDQDKEYRELYELTCYLLTTYNGSAKTFYLGHWEGDWHLRSGYDTKSDDAVTDVAVQGMTDWLNTRQRAVDDARHNTPHARVEVFNYCEVNLAKIAMQGRRTVTNDVLPKTNVDYVSYSSWDSGPDVLPGLDYIESRLPAKPGIPGKRVFIGEYGFPACNHSPGEQDRLARRVMRAGLQWGCPFVLYWEMFNNETDKDGKQRGFWLIDDQGQPQPLYFTHQKYYRWGRQYVAGIRDTEGRLPTPEEFRRAAVEFLDAL